jgi:pSer/pThr/pTyr-binding forkhead associated (FHA) protein
MARLIVAAGGAERTLELTPGKPFSVGREASNDVPLPDERQASRRHCEVRPLPVGGWEVVDLGATNKTRVNGAGVDRRALTTGDVIEVGKVTLRFEDPQEEERLQQAGRQGVCLLEWADGPRKGQRVMLSAPRTTLGRRPGNAIVLDDRMASGHHAEIVKDLNGYTIRDLGSTNGIMVNGTPTTESGLSHGARLRVGNSRFVFKDPSMKDIEVELSRLEDDDGWGMMGDIDLTRARVSKSGTIAMLVVLAVVGAGGWYVLSESDRVGPGGGSEGVGELIVNGSFSGPELPWTYDEDAGVRVERKQALTASNPAGAGTKAQLVAYEDEFVASEGRTLRLRAKLRGAGELVAIWRNEADRATGVTGITRVVALGSGGGGALDTTLSYPSWATALTLALRLGAGQTLTLDDLSVKAVAETPATVLCDCPGLPQGTVEADGSLTLAINRTVLAVGGVPVAWTGEQRLAFRAESGAKKADLTASVAGAFVGGDADLPGSIAWTSTAEGLSASIVCEGADRVAVALDLPRAHLGNTLNVSTVQDARAVALASGPIAADVRKTLAGSPEAQQGRPVTLLAIVPSAGTASLVVEDAGDPSMVRLLHVVAGAKADIAVVTDTTEQRKGAQAALAEAMALVRTSPGAAVRAFRQVMTEYPFEQAVVREAGAKQAELDARIKADVADLKASLRSFRILGSATALTDLEKRLKALRASLGSGAEPPAEETPEAEVAKVGQEADALIASHRVERAAPELDRHERVAEMLERTPGFEAMAALVYRSLIDTHGHLALAGGDSVDRLARWKAALERLELTPQVQGALPPRSH